MKRREFLAILGLVSILAGCGGGSGGNPDPTPTPTPAPTATPTPDPNSVPFGAVRVTFTSFNPGTSGATGDTRLLTPYSDPTKLGTVDKTLAVGSVHWKFPSAYANDDSVKMVTQFNTAQLSVGQTARMPDSYSLTVKIATANNKEIYLAPASVGTLTVTEVGSNYFGFTLPITLKGISGSDATATAVIKGWVVGY
jgi:NADPH-dependent curcumin reductase CurA